MSGIAILGAGAFGTALAVTLAREGQAVTLWTRDPDQAEEMRRTRVNLARLPRVKLPDGVRVTSEVAGIGADCILMAVPVQALRGFLAEHGAALDGRTLVSCGKGIDRETGLRPSQLIARACPKARVAALTGPSFAEDIAAGLPTALTLAVAEDGAGLQARLSTGGLRLYLTHDMLGAELGGALKNVIALAAGVSDGIGFGDNTKAALITRGLAEITRLGTALGAHPETFAGLSGIGDLIVTCASNLSRNRAVGERLGKGETIKEILGGMEQVAEGVWTCKLALEVARKLGVDVPITEQIHAVIYEGRDPKEAVQALMSRDPKVERERRL
jgi:glycerol-3-phosphate dehydrogenase (NAD(P)+)